MASKKKQKIIQESTLSKYSENIVDENVKTIKPKNSLPDIFNKKVFWISLSLLITFLIYLNSLLNGYTLDDVAIYGLNKLTTQGIRAIPELLRTSLFYGYTGIDEGTYRPIPMILVALEHDLFGNTIWLHHLVSVLFYFLCVFLCFNFLNKLFPKIDIFIIGIITLLFACHPIHTEVVSSFKSRDEILACIFIFLSGIQFLKFIDSKSIRSAIFSSLYFFLSLLCKETGIALMILFPLIEFFKNKSIKNAAIASLPLLIAFSGYAIIKTSLFGSISGIKAKIDLVDNVLANVPVFERIGTAIGLYSKYILKLVIPISLSHDYSYAAIPVEPFSIYTILAIILIGFSFWYFWKSKFEFNLINIGILWFFGTSIVTSNIFIAIGSAFAERFMFVPLLGFLMVIIGLLMKLLNDRQIIIFSMGISLIFSFLTINRNKDWKNNLALYKADVSKVDNSARAHYNLGNEYWQEAKRTNDKSEKTEFLSLAEPEVKRAMDIYPDYAEALLTLGNIYHEQGNYDKELEMTDKKAKEGKINPMMLFNAGNAFMEKSLFKDAIRVYKKAISIDKNYLDAFSNMASCYLTLGMNDSAIFYCDEAIRINPALPHCYTNKGQALLNLGKKEEAMKTLNIALDKNPNAPEPYIVLGNLYMEKGDKLKAISLMEKAISLNPEYVEGLYNLGVVYMQSKETDKALKTFQKVIMLKPDYIEANINLGYCYFLKKEIAKSREQYEKVEQMRPGIAGVQKMLIYLKNK